MAQGDTITITDNGDGTYSVAMQDSDSDDASEQQPQTAKSVPEVLQLVQQELTEDGQGAAGGPADAQAAWAAEAQGRDASGRRAPGTPGPRMSM